MRKAAILLGLIALSLNAIAPVYALAEQVTTGTLVVQLRDDVTGEPLPDVGVETLPFAEDGTYGSLVTDADGTATLRRVEPGAYRVLAGHTQVLYSEYLREYYEDEPDFWNADAVDIVGGETTEITMNLALGGKVTGTVTHAWTGEPIPGIWVQPDGPTADFTGSTSAADGTYQAFPLDGDYTIQVWHDDYEDYESEPISVPARTEVTHDIVLTPRYGTPYATIYGYVCEDLNGDRYCDMWSEVSGVESGVAGVTVRVETPRGITLATKTTDPWGGFEFTELEPGKLVVELDEATLPAGMFGVAPTSVTLELGPNESGVAHFFVDQVGVDLHLSVKATPESAVIDDVVDLVVTITFVRSDPVVDPFLAGPIEMQVSLPDGLAYNGHTATGSYSPMTGRWVVPQLDMERSAQLNISTTAETLGAMTVTAEVAGIDFDDPDSTPGDGKGDDFDQVTVVVREIPTILSGIVWLDVDQDGTRTWQEPGLAGIEVMVNRLATGDVIELVTDEDGAFSVSGLADGTYRLVLGDLPIDHFADVDTISVSVGDVEALAEFRVVHIPAPEPEPEPTTGIVSGYVWLDHNENGIREAGEALAQGVRITMVDLATQGQISRTFAEGDFEFTNVTPGMCDLSLDPATVPEGWEPASTESQQVLVAAGDEVTAHFALVTTDEAVLPLPWLIALTAMVALAVLAVAVDVWWRRRTGQSVFKAAFGRRGPAR